MNIFLKFTMNLNNGRIKSCVFKPRSNFTAEIFKICNIIKKDNNLLNCALKISFDNSRLSLFNFIPLNLQNFCGFLSFNPINISNTLFFKIRLCYVNRILINFKIYVNKLRSRENPSSPSFYVI